MELAKVEGSVVSTVKVERLHGQKLLVISLLKPDMQCSGTHLVAIDTVGSGTGDVVLVVRGSSARQTEQTAKIPTDTTIVAIVDTVVYRGQKTYEKDSKGVADHVPGKD